MKNKHVIIGISLVGFALAISFVKPISELVAKSDITSSGWSEVSIKDNYVLNDTFELPIRTITINGSTYNAETRLIYPDGHAIRRTTGQKTAILSTAGNYKVEFIAKDDSGLVHKDTLYFTTLNKLWSYSGEQSSATYGLGNYANQGNEGLNIRLAKGDVFHFNKVIDLSNIDITTKIVSGYITPDIRGAFDFDRLYFKFTDISDDNNYFIFQGRRSLSSSYWYGTSYWTAAGEGQTLTGFESGKNIYHTGDIWGAPYSHSWVAQTLDSKGLPASIPSNQNQFSLNLDPSTNMVYVNGNYVVDLDDASIWGNEPTWKGFNTGKVKLDIYCEDYMAATANFCLTSVLGYDLSTDDILFTDNEGPDIYVDNSQGVIDEDNHTFVYKAVKGGNYSLPSATAIDGYSKNLEVKTKVYYNYDNINNRSEITVKNGKFQTNYLGEYTVVYSATDYFGNIGEEKYSVICVANLEDPLDLILDMNGVKTNEVNCGETVNVANYQIVGGSGPTTLKVVASYADIKIEITKGTFLPEVPGNWTVKYSLTDYSGITVEKSYKVNVTASSIPYFVDEIQLPRYFVNGKQHLIPEVYANDYSSGKVEKVLANISIKDSKGEKTYSAGDVFKPSVSSNLEEVEVIFKAKDGVKVMKVPCVQSTIDGEYFVEKMFVGDGFISHILDDRLNLLASSTDSFASTYASMFLANNSFISFRTIEGLSNFDVVEVTLSDAYNDSLSVTARIENNGMKNAVASVNGYKAELANNFSTPNTEFSVSYKTGTISIGSKEFKVSSYDNGFAFNGFPSNRVYVSLKVINPTVGSGVAVNKVDNASISSIKVDLIKPRIEIEGEHGGVTPINSTIEIPRVDACDNVDQYVPVTVTVTNENDELMSDINGVVLEDVPANVSYNVKLDKYGTCQVNYTAIDSSKKKGFEEITYVVIDTIAPNIKVTGNYQKEVSVGTKANLPTVHITDDNTIATDLIAYRTVRVPNGRELHIGDVYATTTVGGVVQYVYEYTFYEKGTYTFTIHAMDKAGNYSSLSYTVVAK